MLRGIVLLLLLLLLVDGTVAQRRKRRQLLKFSAECYDNAGCAVDEYCAIDPFGEAPNKCFPKLSIGGSCEDAHGDLLPENCESGMCTYLGSGGLCVGCYSNMDCPDGRERCAIDPLGMEPNECVPKLPIGQSCEDINGRMLPEECLSDMCAQVGSSMLCVGCYSNSDCNSDEYCVIDPNGVEPRVCGPKLSLGENCKDSSGTNQDDNCASGMCDDRGLKRKSLCVGCKSSSDCNSDEYCNFDIENGVKPHVCSPKLPNGESCVRYRFGFSPINVGEMCISGQCSQAVCVDPPKHREHSREVPEPAIIEEKYYPASGRQDHHQHAERTHHEKRIRTHHQTTASGRQDHHQHAERTHHKDTTTRTHHQTKGNNWN